MYNMGYRSTSGNKVESDSWVTILGVLVEAKA